MPYSSVIYAHSMFMLLNRLLALYFCSMRLSMGRMCIAVDISAHFSFHHRFDDKRKIVTHFWNIRKWSVSIYHAGLMYRILFASVLWAMWMAYGEWRKIFHNNVEFPLSILVYLTKEIVWFQSIDYSRDNR